MEAAEAKAAVIDGRFVRSAAAVVQGPRLELRLRDGPDCRGSLDPDADADRREHP